jgi:hypothetical protein
VKISGSIFLSRFTASATDADVPKQTLTYSLIGAPDGATINYNTGVFTWTPTEAQGPGTYPIIVRVTDNGTPPQFDEKTFVVTVKTPGSGLMFILSTGQ